MKRTIPIIAASLALLAAADNFILSELHRPDVARDRIGNAVPCDEEFPFSDEGAEILAYGLEEMRGLAVDDSEHVLIVRANRSLLEYGRAADNTKEEKIFRIEPPPDAKRAVTSAAPHDCPETPCAIADRLGVAFINNTIYLAEHGRSRVDTLRTPQLFPDAPMSLSGLTGPVGLAAVSGSSTLFITDDRPWPGTAPGPYDTVDYARWLDANRPRMFGGVYVCELPDCQPRPVTTSIPHPSGIAALSARGPLYVAEADSKDVRWPIFMYNDLTGWIQTGALGTAPITRGSAAPFLGMAIGSSGKYVYAAGPGGLYVFDRDGKRLGTVNFEAPVTGLATVDARNPAPGHFKEPDLLYLAVGHMLCRLQVKAERAGK